MLDGHLWNSHDTFPQSLEVIRRSQGGFPVVYSLRKDVEDSLLRRLVNGIRHKWTSILPGGCTRANRKAIRAFISELKVSSKVVQQIAEMFLDKPAAKETLHLLRGLLVHHILPTTLKSGGMYNTAFTLQEIQLQYHIMRKERAVRGRDGDIQMLPFCSPASPPITIVSNLHN